MIKHLVGETFFLSHFALCELEFPLPWLFWIGKAVIQTLELLIRFGFIRSFQLLGQLMVSSLVVVNCRSSKLKLC